MDRVLPEVHEERAVARRLLRRELGGPFFGRLRVRFSMAEARPVATQVHAPGLRAGQRRDGERDRKLGRAGRREHLTRQPLVQAGAPLRRLAWVGQAATVEV